MNVKEKALTQERLKELLDYNPDTGVFTRKIGLRGAAQKGRIVGHTNKIGYLSVAIDRKSYLCHRLAWLYTHGYFPEHNIDHINRDKKDNRIKNLREVSQQCNARNNGNRKNNSSGIKGICWHEKDRIWAAQITINWRGYIIGRCKDFEEAVFHRLAVEQCLGWDGCDSSSPAYKAAKKILKGERICPKDDKSKKPPSKKAKCRRISTSGVTGVFWNAREKAWVSRIMVNYKKYNIGKFEDFEEAIFHRYAAEQCFDVCNKSSLSPAYQAVQKILRGEKMKPKIDRSKETCHSGNIKKKG